MNRKSPTDHDTNMAIDMALTGWYFELDGTTDPSVFSANIESVTRFTSDGTTPLYRVRFCDPTPYQDLCAVSEALAVVQLEGDDLRAVRVLGALNSGVATEDGREIDVAVKTANTGVSLNTTAAGRYVKSLAALELRDE